MKLFGTKALPLLVFVLVLTSLVEHGQGHVCHSTLVSLLVKLIPCNAAVSPFGPPIPPSEACCKAIKAMEQPCLCKLVKGLPKTVIKRSMALKLCEKCTANFEPCGILK